MIIKAIRIGLLVVMMVMSVYTILFIAIPLLTSSIFAGVLLVVLCVLIFVVLREIYRIIMWKDY